MGLPRALETSHRTDFPECSKADLLLIGFNAGRHASRLAIDALIKAEQKGVRREKIAVDIVRWLLRSRRRTTVATVDNLTRGKARLYIGIADSDAYEEAQFREVDVPKYFHARLSNWNFEREERDRDAIDLRQRISIIRRRVFSSRTFPAFLKAIIFERDNFTCQVCLRGREVLRAAGLHLECDHIVAWADDGKTTYDNGQAICSECNKAKHHSKRYLGLVAHLNGPSR